MFLDQQLQTRLEPATVLTLAGTRVQLELPDELVWAVLALAYPYQPARGDRVLAIGQGEAWYVIGVLRGSGSTSLTLPGDLTIRTPAGSIELISARGVRIKSPRVRIATEKLELLAESVLERFARATRWVKETLHVRAGRLRTRVEGTHDLGAGRILERAEDDVKIDGRKIHLG